MFYFDFVCVYAHAQVLDRPGSADLSVWVDFLLLHYWVDK
jgi:SAM-dependent MidA family methyltransferase